MTVSKHAVLLLEITEDRHHKTMGLLLANDIDLLHHLEERRHREGTEAGLFSEIEIWILTGRVHFHDPDRQGRAPGPFLPDRGLVLHQEEVGDMADATARPHQEEAGGEGVRATLVFPATVTGVAAGLEAGMDEEGVEEVHGDLGFGALNKL